MFITKKTLYKKISYLDDNIIILKPCYTGDFNTVDCDWYASEQNLKRLNYSNVYIENNKNNNIIYDSKKYYYAGRSPYYIDDTWYPIKRGN